MDLLFHPNYGINITRFSRKSTQKITIFLYQSVSEISFCIRGCS